MASGHPLDELGRELPDCTWPADKAAPDGLDLIRRFCNTCNHESGADRFETIEGLRRWLDDQQLSAVDDSPDESDRRRLVAVREHLRGQALAHHDGTADSSFAVPLDACISDVPIALNVDGGRLTICPTALDVAGRTIGLLAMAVMDAQRSDRWRRFKACPGCEWVFYDRSKNQSGRWCSMNACGGRAKVAAFRERQREAAT
jgi:predicted RNA-binding Zn ribbon-like protein